MRKTNLSNLAAILLFGAGLCACSSGGNSSNSNPSNNLIPVTDGPINPKIIDGQFYNYYSNSPHNLTAKSLNSNTTSSLAKFGIMDLVPYAEFAYYGVAAISDTFDLITGNTPQNTLNSDFNAIESSIQYLTEITTQINTDLNDANNNITNLIVEMNQDTTHNSLVSYNNAVIGVYPIWNSLFNTVDEYNSIESFVNSRTGVKDFANIYNTTWLNYQATSSYYTSITNTNATSDTIWNGTSYNLSYIAINSQNYTDLGGALYEMESLVLDYVPFTGGSAIANSVTTDLVSNLNSYNLYLVNIYESSIASLQTAYNIEATANYIRYASPYSNPPYSNPLDGSALPTATQYICKGSCTPGSPEAYDAYILAQTNLAKFFGQMINGLYLSLMVASFTDPALSGQAVINNYAESYQSMINLATIAKTMQGSLSPTNPTGYAVSTNQVPVGSWIESMNLYENPYLGAYKQCASNLYNNNQINCPLIFTTPLQGYYDGTTLTAVTAQNKTNSINLNWCANYSAPLTNLGANMPAVSGSESGISANTHGTMQCNTYANFSTQPGASLLSSSLTTNANGINWSTQSCISPYTCSDYWNPNSPNVASGVNSFVTNSTHQGYSVYLNNTSWAGSNTIISSNNFNLMIGFNMGSNGELTSGGGSNTEVGYVQVTTPNGTILPLYLGYSYNNSNGGMSLQCPMESFNGSCSAYPVNNSSISNWLQFNVSDQAYAVGIVNTAQALNDLYTIGLGDITISQCNTTGNTGGYGYCFFPGEPNQTLSFVVLDGSIPSQYYGSGAPTTGYPLSGGQ